MTDNRDAFDHYNVCRSCGESWADHLGIAGTCAKALRFQAENADLRLKLAQCENRNAMLVDALEQRNRELAIRKGSEVKDDISMHYTTTDALAIIRCHADTLGTKHGLPMSRELLLNMANDVESMANELRGYHDAMNSLRELNDPNDVKCYALCPNYYDTIGNCWEVIDVFAGKYTPISKGKTPWEAVQAATKKITKGAAT